MPPSDLQRLASGSLGALSHSSAPAAPPAGPTGVEDEGPACSPTERIRNSIRDALDSDPRVPSAQVGIAVSDTFVALFGTMPDEATRRIALKLTRAVPGVVRVLDRLRVGTAPLRAKAKSKKPRGRSTIRKFAVPARLPPPRFHRTGKP